MTLQIWFWLFMALWLIFGFWRNYSSPVTGQPLFIGIGGHVLSFILFAILGWQVFGSPVKQMILADAVVGQNFWEHLQIFASGSFAIGLAAHIVQTFPTPENKYAQWFLGTVQYLVGQRVRALNTIAGEGTLTKSVSRETQNPTPKIDAPAPILKDKTNG